MHADEWSRAPDEKGRLKGIFRGKLPDNTLAQPVFLYKAVRRVNGEKNMTITRRFSVGIESPRNTETAWGVYVPALDGTGYGCVSAADTQEGIEAAAREAILAMTTYMQAAGEDLRTLRDAGTAEYRGHPDYQHCDRWLMIDAELPE